MRENPIYLVYGPTASGKSQFALELAERVDGVILCADSLQVYRDYRILTARPSLDDEARAEHQLFGFLSAHQPYSVGEWLKDIQQFLQSKRALIIVGGTGLYFNALTKGLVDIPPIADELVQSWDKRFQEFGLEYLQAEFQKIPNAFVNTVDFQNPRRLIRAITVFESTGKSLTEWQEDTPPSLVELSNAEPIVIMPNTQASAQSIRERFYQMLDEGALDEVRNLMNPWKADAPAHKAIGAKELAAYLQGEMELEEAVEKSVIATLQYAKRQRSFARGNFKNWQYFTSWQEAWAQYS